MILQPRVDVVTATFAAQGFNQLNIRRQPGEKAQFEQAFVPFAGRVGVIHDAAAGVAAQRPRGRDGQRADGYVEAEVAIGRDPADSAAVDAARAGFERAQNFHGANLWRAGHRATGKQRLQNLAQRRTHRAGRHGGGHLPQRAIGLGLEQRRHLHAARWRESAEVVADQVHNHQVFGAVLFAGGERAGRLVDGGGALHRFAGQRVAASMHKQLGRARHQAAVGVQYQRAVVHRLGRAQALVEPIRVAESAGAERKGEVRLIAVAVGDVGFDLADGSEVAFAAELGFEIDQPGRLCAVLRVQPGVGGGIINLIAARKDPSLQ